MGGGGVTVGSVEAGRTTQPTAGLMGMYNPHMSTPLLQADADSLRTMPKRLTKASRANFAMPNAGEAISLALESMDGRIAFFIDVNRRGRIKLTKCTYLERYRVVDCLARLDLDGPPHTNPTAAIPPLPILTPYNGAAVPCRHYHFFVEGYDDRWAVPASVVGFAETRDLVQALRDFMTHCGVLEVPTIQYPMQ